jgi:Uncharacterized protein contain chitin-binding domain type 3
MKRLFFLVLAVLLLLPTIGQVSAEEALQGACTSGGDGTAESPYVLCTQADLELLRTYPASHFELGADVLMTGQWATIPSFSGVLDGKDHEIRNLKSINAMITTIESSGEIKNLKLEQLVVSSDHFQPSRYPGGLANANYGIVRNISITGTVGNRFGAGLLANSNYGTIQNCRASGSVGSEEGGAGGLVAYNSGTIVDSYSNAKVSGVYGAGGIAVSNSGVIQNTVAHGNVSGFATDIGGLVGRNETTGMIDQSNAYGNVAVYSYTKNYGLLYGINLGQVTDSAGYGTLDVTDNDIPSKPANVQLTAKTHDSISVSWDASRDGGGILGYDIMQDGMLAGTTSATNYTLNGLEPNTTYSITIVAKDNYGNVSNPSDALSVTTDPAPAPTEPIFSKGINFNGSSVTVEGNIWLPENAAGVISTSTARRYTDHASLQPTVNSQTNLMLNSALFSDKTFSIRLQIANGTYQIYLWSIETYLANFRSFNVKMEGATVTDSPIGTMPLNEWRKYGPFTVTVQDGVLDMELVKVFGDPSISGMAIYSVDTE